MLEVTSLNSGYGRIPIIHGVSLKVEKGEALGILGHNGMGKTTLLKTLAGHILMTSGKIVLGDTDISRASPDVRARLGVGYVPQGRMIFPKLTVWENLRIGAVAAKQPDTVLDEVLDELPRLKPILKRAGGVLSGGEQQILALGRCLCGRPDLMLLDEPTEGIQPSIIDELIMLLKTLKVRHGLTIVLVEQHLNFIRQLSDRVLVIQRGLIRSELKPSQLKDAALVEELLNMNHEMKV
jgi:branched-chain amino acid transport system ATP-binding protein